MSETGEIDERLFLRSVARAFAVLEVWSAEPRALSLGEIAKAAGIDKSAAQRICQTLVGLGYLERAPGGLVPGKRALDRAFDYLRITPLIERAAPVLATLRETCGERVDLSLFDGTTILYALRLQSRREAFFATLPGRRLPAFCTSGGRACMALMSDAAVERLLARSDLVARTRKTLTDPAAVLEKVREAREQGYACVMEETLLGEVVVAAPVTDSAGRPVAAVHIAGTLAEWSEAEYRRRFAPHAIAAADALSG
ncbi:IclR family transcriptional regulator [Pseudooceanicola sp. 502str34]